MPDEDRKVKVSNRALSRGLKARLEAARDGDDASLGVGLPLNVFEGMNRVAYLEKHSVRQVEMRDRRPPIVPRTMKTHCV